MKPQTFKVGDIVVTESFVNATLYRVVEVDDGMLRIAMVKFSAPDKEDEGLWPSHQFFHLNGKQKEEYRERLQQYRSKINNESN